jgi:hypothetical protein
VTNYKIGTIRRLQLVSSWYIEAIFPKVSKNVSLLEASLSFLFRFSLLQSLNLIKERRVNPPLFKDQDERGRCLVLENSPPILRDLHVRKEKRKCSFSFPKYTREENEAKGVKPMSAFIVADKTCTAPKNLDTK